jgi:hypothetical protein
MEKARITLTKTQNDFFIVWFKVAKIAPIGKILSEPVIKITNPSKLIDFLWNNGISNNKKIIKSQFPLSIPSIIAGDMKNKE